MPVSAVDVPRRDSRAVEGLADEVLALTPAVGPNPTGWPGLTAYRFTRPQPSQWAEVRSLALCYVVRGRKRFVVDGDEYLCDPEHHLLFTRGMRFEAEILEATGADPYLSVVLQIDPTVVSSVLADLVDHRTTPGRPAGEATPPAAPVSASGHDLGGAVLRFLRALAGEEDRRVLAPLCLREVTYRLMRTEQVSRLLRAAATEREAGPVSRVIRYIHEHLSEPMTVADMARHVLMSPSALTSAFVEATGSGPYQFAKRVRLDRAAALLLEGRLNVSEVSREVGYTSPSYFINEFKRRYGTTPRAYATAQRRIVAMRVEEATSRHGGVRPGVRGRGG